MFEFISKYVSQKKFFLSSVTVKSYIPGRIRCYSALVHGNPENSEILKSCFSSFSELDEFTVNSLTGSILICYEPEKLRKNKFLASFEKDLITKYQRGTK